MIDCSAAVAIFFGSKGEREVQPTAYYQGGVLIPKDDMIPVEGTVTESLPNATFKVQIGEGHQILAHLSGKMRKNFIRISVGDKVKVEMSPYDLGKARITYRDA